MGFSNNSLPLKGGGPGWRLRQAHDPHPGLPRRGQRHIGHAFGGTPHCMARILEGRVPGEERVDQDARLGRIYAEAGMAERVTCMACLVLGAEEGGDLGHKERTVS